MIRSLLGTTGLVVVMATSATAQRPSDPAPSAGAREPFPAFDLPTPDRGRVTLADFRGQMLLVNFWASWCTPCRTEMPELDRLRQELAGQDIAFLGLNADVDRRRAVRFLAEAALDLPIAFGGPRLQRAYRYPGLPYTVLVDSEGRVIRRWIGQLTTSSLAEIRTAIVAERRRHTPMDDQHPGTASRGAAATSGESFDD